MSHFAKVKNGLVTDIIVAEQDFIDSGLVGDPSLWIQTSYNTHGNLHYGADRKPDGKLPLRGNYAVIGGSYDAENDVFLIKKPFNSWVINKNTWLWESQIPMPADGKNYYWNESTLEWINSPSIE
jgi:hypothetical protein